MTREAPAPSARISPQLFGGFQRCTTTRLPSVPSSRMVPPARAMRDALFVNFTTAPACKSRELFAGTMTLLHTRIMPLAGDQTVLAASVPQTSVIGIWRMAPARFEKRDAPEALVAR